MDTERLSPRFADIDLWDSADALEAMIAGQFAAVAAVRAAFPAIERAALAMQSRLMGEGRLIYAGAGTSGRLAVLDGAELMPTFAWPRDRLVLLMAGGEEAMTRAVEGAEDATEQAIELLRRHCVNQADALVAVAASGTTPFTVACLREARRLGALTVGIANNRDTPLLRESDHPILLETGAEPIAGSTRMNAGSAQRVTLTLLSTLLMIRLGRVYRGLMVEVQAANHKLVARKTKMLCDLSGKSERAVEEALLQAKGSVKLALLLLQGFDFATAEALLEQAKGNLRAAIDLAHAHSWQDGTAP